MYALVASSMPNQSGRSRRIDAQSRERSSGSSTATTSACGTAELRAIGLTGGPNRPRYLVGLVVRERPTVEQQPAVPDDPDDRRLADPERECELLLDRARRARDLGERQRAAAHPRNGLLHLAPHGCREALCALTDPFYGLVEHAQDGDLTETRVEHRGECALE